VSYGLTTFAPDWGLFSFVSFIRSLRMQLSTSSYTGVTGTIVYTTTRRGFRSYGTAKPQSSTDVMVHTITRKRPSAA
jgi:hypothetical protein